MPCMGPGRSVNEKMVENIANMVYDGIKDCIEHNRSNYNFLHISHRTISFCLY